MQLTSKQHIASALAIASCSLIGQQAYAADPQLTQDDWKVDAAIMYYGEQDRVQAAEAIGNVQKAFGDTSLLDMKIVVDSLTGASASGAVAQAESQTFTRPSGKGEYTINAGDTPLDDTFHDTRVQLSANWQEVLNQDWTTNVGVYASKEFDYLSMGVNAGLERSLNKNNTTLSLSAAFTNDIVDPVGGRPMAMSQMVFRDNYESDADYQAAFDQTRLSGDDTKQTSDIMFGVTQILNRNWLMQANYGLSSVSGYMTDPYKILSEVDLNGQTQAYRYENRPDSRLKHSVFVMTKGALDSGVVDFSYRYSTDDWDIQSHTLETHYRYNLSPTMYAQLHLRYYQQQAAEFYQPFLLSGEDLPEYASADYRIGDMTAYTVGVKFGQRLSNGHEMSYRLEYYQQNPDNNGTVLPGQLQQYDLFPSVKAIVAQVSYSF
ncbi:DUF3570 domain-containing protein [Shewanella inventionis]|uniref:DUF3570 domain-containing protein n=1 Tax=Shewanella inventionis TaxID=1738770 RepID=A0ABQ1IT24_9GAMM|nr:DUF3570 domain-containing protein [Shewanella inventionis]MCL1156673.1 DUF3570 domain-containing protein [Shewanella inventionis]UAL44887.1 DUF3570 domain-containing protein [Shewanella inventionis]GGB50523.1 hypothetical protein GCM10011607_08660 [Shewanella inventionis]